MKLACYFIGMAICYATPSVLFESDEGIFPDPENCQNFYQCGSDGDCTLFACDPALLFDAELLICNYAELVDCGDRPNPIATSSSAPVISTTNTNVHSTTTTTHNDDNGRYPKHVLGMYLLLGTI